MAELVDALDLGSSVLRRGGSSPPGRTRYMITLGSLSCLNAVGELRVIVFAAGWGGGAVGAAEVTCSGLRGHSGDVRSRVLATIFVTFPRSVNVVRIIMLLIWGALATD